LERRLEELNALNPAEVQSRVDERFRTVELKIEDTLVSIFGNDTVEYSRYRVGSLDTAPVYVGHPASLQEVREGYKRGKDKAATKLQTIIDLFKEKLQELGENPGGRALRAIGELDLHPEIDRAVSSLFRSGHYANAIEDGCKALDALVKMRSGRYDLSGTELMNTVFSVKNPILRFNDGETESDKSEQQGMMHLYAGVMLAFRNPRAHEIIEDDPEKALEVLSFISFLAKVLDKATRKE
jgi:uncharacterized protein (TIGR02391 family)